MAVKKENVLARFKKSSVPCHCFRNKDICKPLNHCMMLVEKAMEPIGAVSSTSRNGSVRALQRLQRKLLEIWIKRCRPRKGGLLAIKTDTCPKSKLVNRWDIF